MKVDNYNIFCFVKKLRMVLSIIIAHVYNITSSVYTIQNGQQENCFVKKRR